MSPVINDRRLFSGLGEEIEMMDLDSNNYVEQRDFFIKNLFIFHEQRGTPIYKLPLVGGKQLDLFLLYKCVTKHGGWEKVSNENNWNIVYSLMYPGKVCGNADYALKQLYTRFLYHYEKYHFFGMELETRDDGGDAEEARKKLQTFISNVPFTYNYSQHNINDVTRELLGLITVPDSNYNPNYHSLEKSLASGLPNEIDFSINVCLLLSNDHKHCLRGPKSLKVIELLLSHIGLTKAGSFYRWHYKTDTYYNFYQFWNESVDDEDVKHLICPESLLTVKIDAESVKEDEGGPKEIREPDVKDLSKKYSKLPRLLGTFNKESQRIEQIVQIIRNFLADDENVEVLSTSLTLFRFLMLCVYNHWSNIRHMGLESLAYLSAKLALEPGDCKMSQLMIQTTFSCLQSNDRFDVIKGCQLLSNLSQTSVNEDLICQNVGEGTIEQLMNLLLLRDLNLFLVALEALYQLSEVGNPICQIMTRVHKYIECMVGLLTVDGDCEFVDATLDDEQQQHQLASVAAHQQQQQQQIQLQQQLLIQQQQMQIQQQQKLQVVLKQQNQQSNIKSPPPQPQNNDTKSPSLENQKQDSKSDSSPSNLNATNSTTTTSTTLSTTTPTLSTITTSPFSTSIDDKEKIALTWLASQYESSRGRGGGGLTKLDLYRSYVSECSIKGLQNIININAFEKCIKLAFSPIDSNKPVDLILKDISKKSHLSPPLVASSPSPSPSSSFISSASSTSIVDNVSMATNPQYTSQTLVSNIQNPSTNSLTSHNNFPNQTTTSSPKSSVPMEINSEGPVASLNSPSSTCASLNSTTSNNQSINNITKTTTITSPTSSPSSSTFSIPKQLKFHCDWIGCQSAPFDNYNQIYRHVMSTHGNNNMFNSSNIFNNIINSSNNSYVCKWTGCDQLPRMKWSFIAHLLDRHLSRQILAASSLHHWDSSHPLPPLPQPTIYPPNAAVQAIRKLNPRLAFHEFMDMKEENLTKHIHLTSALIIRNLARYSQCAKSLLKKYETRLAIMAFSSSESSSVLSSCLFEIHNFHN